uniref:Uncharacterized protein n=1 Tax=Anguilla anguilla TaxID=7936 RepID=A0A0E9SKG1_ANGAN
MLLSESNVGIGKHSGCLIVCYVNGICLAVSRGNTTNI